MLLHQEQNDVCPLADLYGMRRELNRLVKVNCSLQKEEMP